MLSIKLATTNQEKSFGDFARGRGLTKRERWSSRARGAGPQNPGPYGDGPLTSPVEHNCVGGDSRPLLGMFYMFILES